MSQARGLRFYPPHLTQILNLTEQLQGLQRLPATELRAMQHQQLQELVRHAERYSPYWKGVLGQSSSVRFDQLPTLSRQTVQAQAAALRAHWPGLKSDQIMVSQSSGSTGTPVRVEKYRPRYQPLYSAISWLEHTWHQRDANQRFAVLGIGLKPAKYPAWGDVYAALGFQGESEIRAAESDTLDGHLNWLLAFQPDYLKCSPNLAAELAQQALNRGITLPLTQIISNWERIKPQHREVCLQAFSAPIVDRYSCEELGWLALQCPTHGNLHVLSPSVLLEIVDDAGRPCPPGVTGRVLVTGLHSQVMPLIRYELGDLAEWGEPCACGSSWPVISKLWGRTRHMIERQDGRRIPMPFLGDELASIAAIRAFQIRQIDRFDFELRVDSARALSDAELTAVRLIFQSNGLPGQPRVLLDQQHINWGAGRKRQEFIPLQSASGP